MILSDVSPSVVRSIAHLCCTLTVMGVAGCGSERPTAPAVTGADAASQFGALAFTAAVNVRTGAVTIAAPIVTSSSTSTRVHSGSEAPSLSLLGSDVVRLVPTNVRVSSLGAFTPNRTRITFDVTLENKLQSLALSAPSWPVPPAPYVILFPLDYTVTSAPGGVTGSDGNSVGVGLPGRGTVTPSDNWNGVGISGSGAPYSFFNNVVCGAAVTDGCFRWVSFGAHLEPTRDRPTRTIGFDIDPSVAQFRARMIVAADLVPAAPVLP